MSSKSTPSLILSPSDPDYAGSAEAVASAKRRRTHRTSESQGESSSSPKDVLPPETEASSLPCICSIQGSTCVCSLPTTTGVPSSTSKDIPSGLLPTVSSTPWGNEYPKIGLSRQQVGELLDEERALASQVGGDHYRNMKIQPVEYIIANGIGFLPGNIIKYASRYPDKGGAEDIRKIIHYCKLILEFEYGEK